MVITEADLEGKTSLVAYEFMTDIGRLARSGIDGEMDVSRISYAPSNVSS